MKYNENEEKSFKRTGQNRSNFQYVIAYIDMCCFCLYLVVAILFVPFFLILSLNSFPVYLMLHDSLRNDVPVIYEPHTFQILISIGIYVEEYEGRIDDPRKYYF